MTRFSVYFERNYMKSIRLRLYFAAALVTALSMAGSVATMEQAAAPAQAPAPAVAQAPATSPAAKKTIGIDEITAWKNIGATALSNNGEWFAYRVAPQEGDAELVVKNIATGKETKYPLGEVGAPAGAPAPAGPPVFLGGASLAFSDDSKWIAFNTSPARAEAQRLRRQRRPVQGGVMVVNLASGEKKEYPRIRRFDFNGDTSTHIALHRAPATPAPGAGGAAAAAPPAPGGRGGGAGGDSSDRPRGTDLIIRELATGAELNFGNVSEFAFTRDGKFLASVIDATDKIGNGVQLRNMLTGTVSSLDTDTANYERLSWTEKGEGLTVLKGKEDRAFTDKMYSIVGFTGFGSGEPKKTEYDPAKDTDFPKGFWISGNRAATWNEKIDAFVFGIHEPRKRTTPATPGTTSTTDSAEPPATPPTGPAAPAEDPDEKVDLVLWHWKDPRLQSQQQVQESSDRTFSYTSMYHVGSKKFVRLADDELRTVTLAPKHKFAVGYDDREYELMGNLDGRRFRDVYVIDPATGSAQARAQARPLVQRPLA